MTIPIRDNPFSETRLEAGVLRTCQMLQRKGFTLTEIAQRLELDRADVVYELYWKAVRR